MPRRSAASASPPPPRSHGPARFHHANPLPGPAEDTIAVRRDHFGILDPTGSPQFDTLKTFRWHDPWIRIEGSIARDSVRCRVSSVDTLRQVIHRIPRRSSSSAGEPRALRQEIVSSNPHTRIVYAEYIRIER